jgi:hypothetical protein
MEFDTECASYRATSSSIREERSPKTQSAQLEVLAYGQDFYLALKHRIYELSLDQTATITLLIPTWQPVPEEIDSELNVLGFFFTGYVHATTELWYLHYTALINQKFNFEDVKVYDSVGIELKEYIQKGYDRAIP